MMTKTQIKANKMWTDVMNGRPATFISGKETRTVCRHGAYLSVMESKQEEIVALTISGKGADMYLKFEAMKLVMQLLVEAIEDFDDE